MNTTRTEAPLTLKLEQLKVLSPEQGREVQGALQLVTTIIQNF